MLAPGLPPKEAQQHLHGGEAHPDGDEAGDADDAANGRPVAQLLAYARVPLSPGESRIVRFRVPASRLAFSGIDLARVVEPGTVELWTGTSERRLAAATVDLAGPVHRLTGQEPRLPVVAVG